MIAVDLRERVHAGAGIGVVRGGVEAVANAAAGIRRAAGIARVHHRRDAGDLRLVREHLQVEHQLDVILERLGHADGRFGNVRRRSADCSVGLLDAALDFADVVEILAEAGAVARIERAAAAASPCR